MTNIVNQISDWLLGHKTPTAIKEKVIEKGYTNPNPSLPDYLSMVDFCDDHNLFLLGDGLSVGSGFELASLPAEAASERYLQAVFTKVKDTFATVVPLHKVDPWVMQMYVQDDYSLAPFLKHLEKTIEPTLLQSAFTQDYLQRLADLLAKMARKDGLFHDPKTGGPYRGRLRRIRVLFYRRYQEESVSRSEAVTEHLEVIAQITAKLRQP